MTFSSNIDDNLINISVDLTSFNRPFLNERIYNHTVGLSSWVVLTVLFNTLSAKDGDLRLSASNACLPKTEISVFVTECVFFTSTCYKLHMFTLHDVAYS